MWVALAFYCWRGGPTILWALLFYGAAVDISCFIAERDNGEMNPDEPGWEEGDGSS